MCASCVVYPGQDERSLDGALALAARPPVPGQPSFLSFGVTLGALSRLAGWVRAALGGWVLRQPLLRPPPATPLQHRQHPSALGLPPVS